MSTPDINKLLRANPRSCQYGAPLGAANRYGDADDARETPRLYCQRIRFVDGDYSADGTYWGGGSRLWCVFNERLSVRIFIRAATRKAALDAFLAEYQHLTVGRCPAYR
jgi:hypothetical protein